MVVKIIPKIFSFFLPKLLKKIRGSSIVNSNIHHSSKIEAGSDVKNTNFSRHSFCGYDCEIYDTDVGSFCSIGNGVKIGGGEHPVNWVSTSPVFYSGRDSIKQKYSTHNRNNKLKTIIGHDCWIGQNALIKQGVKIGTGSVVGMGSVVTKDIEPYSIVAGNPASLIRKRFCEKDIQALIKSKWWELADEHLAVLSQNIKDPATFLKKIKQIK